MAEPICQPALTRDEQALIVLLRHGPQSVAGLAGALQTSAGQMQDALQGLSRKVGLVPLFRSGTLCYGLAE
jgi:hypothetical protein